MSNGSNVAGPQRPRGLMGPVILITVGVIFLAGQMGFGRGFRDLWPVILIVIGLVKIYESLSSGSSGSGSAPPGSTPAPGSDAGSITGGSGEQR